MKRTPIVAYKDMKEGLFVHELISGLNKLTRYILSPEELFSFLIEFLFRNEILPLINQLNSFTQIEGDIDFINKPISQIFTANENELFKLPSILNNDNIASIGVLLDKLQKSMNKIAGIKWLIQEKEAQKIATCGVGV